MGPQARRCDFEDISGALVALQEPEEVIGKRDLLDAPDIEVDREEILPRPETDGEEIDLRIQVQVVLPLQVAQEFIGRDMVVQAQVEPFVHRIHQRTGAEVGRDAHPRHAQSDGQDVPFTLEGGIETEAERIPTQEIAGLQVLGREGRKGRKRRDGEGDEMLIHRQGL